MMRHLLISTALVSFAALPSFAQDIIRPPTEALTDEGALPADQSADELGTEQAATNSVRSPPSEAIVTAESETDMRAENLLGTSVMSVEGEEVGSIEDILFDQEGQIIGLVLSVDAGLFGLGSRLVGIAWDEIELISPGHEVFVTFTEEQLEIAPSFKTQEAITAEAEAERLQQEQLLN